MNWSDIDPEKLLLVLLVIIVIFQQFRITVLQRHHLHMMTMITDVFILLKAHAEGREILKNGKLDGEIPQGVRGNYYHAKDK